MIELDFFNDAKVGARIKRTCNRCHKYSLIVVSAYDTTPAHFFTMHDEKKMWEEKKREEHDRETKRIRDVTFHRLNITSN